MNKKYYKSITQKDILQVACCNDKNKLIDLLQNSNWRSTKTLIKQLINNLNNSTCAAAFLKLKDDFITQMKLIANKENSLRLYNAIRYQKKLREAYLKQQKKGDKHETHRY